MKMLHEGDMGQQADTDETQMPVMLTGAWMVSPNKISYTEQDIKSMLSM